MSLISQVVLRKKTLNPSNFLGERLTSVCLLISTQGFGLGLRVWSKVNTYDIPKITLNSMILQFLIFDITDS